VSRFGTALRHAWNVFTNQDTEDRLSPRTQYYGSGYSGARPDRVRFRIPNERSIVASIYTRLGIDVASIEMRHVRTNDDGQYLEDMDSGLNNCLTVEANIDQAATAFRQDIAMTLFDDGCAVIVPVDTSISPEQSGGFDILTLRVGRIVEWFPQHVRVSLYNEATGRRQEITLLKSSVAIIENPLYSIMNEPNSTLQRLLHKLNLLDAIDEVSASGKLDLIIQLPYVIKSESRRQQAEQRRKDIEFQLKGSQYGIAYTDGTEKVIQLNRPAMNNLMDQITFLTSMLYSQLGLTDEIMNGTADEKTVLNYWNRTIEPILTAISEGLRRSFLTKTARSQKQSILYFRDPFKLVPIGQIAEIADKFTRNEIASANEIRSVVGWRPSKEPKADKLINSNMPVPDTGVSVGNGSTPPPAPIEDPTAMLDNMDKIINDAFSSISATNGAGP
jgi:hypothetical protein